MSIFPLIQQHISEIHNGGGAVFRRKLRWVATFFFNVLRKFTHYFVSHPFDLFAIPIVFGIRLIRPWFIVRFGGLLNHRIGHFAANTELYLCERDAGINVPSRPYADFHYLAYRPICNKQLLLMWKRVLRIWPSSILAPVVRVNRWIPGGAVHEIGNNTRNDRDVHNLLDRFPPHLRFTAEEETLGETGLRTMGMTVGTPFVCLIVRDSAYLDGHQQGDWSYHNFRDSDIQSCVFAAEELANLGYYVIRMGSVVHRAMKTAHPMVIDYAAKGMRSDFMDIYLGAKCTFCITNGTGWDSIPWMLRRPIVDVNNVPLAQLRTFSAKYLAIIKKHALQESHKILNVREIFAHGVGFSLQTADYESKGVQLIENTPEEIRDVAIEMAERLNGTWQAHDDDDALQKRFQEIFRANMTNASQGGLLHGEIRSRFGANFLRNNRDWLQ